MKCAQCAAFKVKQTTCETIHPLISLQRVSWRMSICASHHYPSHTHTLPSRPANLRAFNCCASDRFYLAVLFFVPLKIRNYSRQRKAAAAAAQKNMIIENSMLRCFDAKYNNAQKPLLVRELRKCARKNGTHTLFCIPTTARSIVFCVQRTRAHKNPMSRCIGTGTKLSTDR